MAIINYISPRRIQFDANASLDLERSSSQLAGIPNGSQTGLGITGDMTIKAYIKFETALGTSNVYTFVSKSNASGNQRGYIFRFSDVTDVLQFGLSTSGTSGTFGTVNVTWNTWSTGTWYEVWVTYNATSGATKFYVGSTQQGSTQTQSTGGAFANTADFGIGTTPATSDYMDGLMSEVAIWDKELSAAEITARAGGALSPSDANLQGYWTFQGNYQDATSNGNHLTPVNNPVFVTDRPF